MGSSKKFTECSQPQIPEDATFNPRSEVRHLKAADADLREAQAEVTMQRERSSWVKA